ncbi:toll-like receptor 2 [Saccostrea cucullata]|uniref:toll-like receptor 2 n=1 Tax=Saccostrea cuccullata TaxID=36930 RepID=UPI002ED66C04
MDTENFISQGFCLKHVTFLNISKNLFKEIAVVSFDRMSNLQTLIADNLRGAAVDKWSLSSHSLQRLSIGPLIKTRVKDFTQMFENCPNIKELKIMKTDLSTTNVTRMLTPLKGLSSLTILNGELKEIIYLNAFTKLDYIDFGFNKIKETQAIQFQNLTNLKTLVLSNNRLNSMNKSFLPSFLWERKDFMLDVCLNPLDCGCQLEWFRIWIENNVNRAIGYPERYICDSPSELNGKSLSNFDPASDCHMISPYIILTCVSLALFSFVILSIYLLRKFRWDIKYYVYICKNRKPFGYKRFTDDEAFLYDAFVAYNTKDRYWIMSELVEMVERNDKHKLCLHERDIIPGGVYVDDILESIDTSRKFILVLSNNFMDDQWCMYEAALANHTLADGDGHKLLLILLEDIRSEHINKSLKVLLKSTSYVEWTKNKNGLKIFWQTIKQFMKK